MSTLGYGNEFYNEASDRIIEEMNRWADKANALLGADNPREALACVHRQEGLTMALKILNEIRKKELENEKSNNE